MTTQSRIFTRTKWNIITKVLLTDSADRQKSLLVAELCCQTLEYTLGFTLWKVGQIIVLRCDLQQPVTLHTTVLIYTQQFIHLAIIHIFNHDIHVMCHYSNFKSIWRVQTYAQVDKSGYHAHSHNALHHCTLQASGHIQCLQENQHTLLVKPYFTPLNIYYRLHDPKSK